MNLKIFSALLSALLLAGCMPANRSEMLPRQEFTRLQAEQPKAPGGIKVVKTNSKVHPGEKGSITILAEPNTVYNITSSYKVGGRMLTATQSRTTGVDGRVTWTWNVGKDTVKGVYPIIISGGGKMLVSEYTVF